MDDYTLEVRDWLNRRFAECDENGVYFAHQPIYGFRKGHCSLGTVTSYMRTYQLMRALSHLEFHSALDVGGAEGYAGHLMRQFFGAEVVSSDLSEQACCRAHDIFGLESSAAEIHCLPFKDSCFDVVLCSQTLEHVPHPDRAIEELVRVARKAVVITVPHDSKKSVEANITKHVLHGHINRLGFGDFDFLKSRDYGIVRHRILSRILRIPRGIAEATPRMANQEQRRQSALAHLYDSSALIRRRVFNERVVALMIDLDNLLCRVLPLNDAILVVVLKDKGAWMSEETCRVTALDVLNIAIPYHLLRRTP